MWRRENFFFFPSLRKAIRRDDYRKSIKLLSQRGLGDTPIIGIEEISIPHGGGSFNDSELYRIFIFFFK